MTTPAGHRRRFSILVLALWFGSFVVASVATPPDPFSQLVALVPLLLGSVVAAYLAVYRLDW